MKRTFLLLSLFLTLQLSGQILPGVVASQGGAAAPSSNMLTNGTFDDATGWDLTGGWSITGGVAVYTAAGGNGFIRQLGGAMVTGHEAGTAYTLTFTLTKTAGANAYFGIWPYYSAGGASYRYVVDAEYAAADITIHYTTYDPLYEYIGVPSTGWGLYMYADGSYTIDNIVLTKD